MKNYLKKGNSPSAAADMFMELHVFLKTQPEPVIYKGDRIDVLDFEIGGTRYKQIRFFRKGFSKSELVEESGISRIERKE
jgi:hypothetical protein